MADSKEVGGTTVIPVEVNAVVSHTFTDADLREMALSAIPYPIKVRIVLNSKGFKFADDGQVGLIVNHAPVPLGVMRCWRDEEKMTTTYEQIIVG